MGRFSVDSAISLSSVGASKLRTLRLYKILTVKQFLLMTQKKKQQLVFTLDAGLLARSQHSEGPATGHLDTGFSWFHCA